MFSKIVQLLADADNTNIVKHTKQIITTDLRAIEGQSVDIGLVLKLYVGDK